MQVNSLIFEMGDIVIIELPFSNLADSKLRPAVVISNNYYNNEKGDVILVKITGSHFNTEWELPITKKDIIGNELKKESYIDIGFVTTLEKSLIVKKVGKLKKQKIDEIKSKLKKLFI